MTKDTVRICVVSWFFKVRRNVRSDWTVHVCVFPKRMNDMVTAYINIFEIDKWWMKREKGKEKICAERMMRHEYIMENDVNMCFFATNTLVIEQTKQIET